MDDTQSFEPTHPPAVAVGDEDDPVAALAALDPADAPGAAERYAAALADELEDEGAPPSEPVQMQADLGTEP